MTILSKGENIVVKSLCHRFPWLDSKATPLPLSSQYRMLWGKYWFFNLPVFMNQNRAGWIKQMGKIH